MKNKAPKSNKLFVLGIIPLLLAAVINICLNEPLVDTGYKMIKQSSEELNSIYAEIIENNRKKLENIEDYGDEFCYPYVSTSSDIKVHRKILDEIQQLSDDICAGCETDYEKVKAIAYWVADNIYYNHVAAETSVDPDTISLETTLKIKATTCAGYSNMFSALCNMQGLYCVNLRGGTHARDRTSEYLLNARMNHEWNAVMIGEKWIFADTAWLSNNKYTEEGYQKAGSFDDQYFDMSFEYMSYEHRIDINDHRDFKSSVNALKNISANDNLKPEGKYSYLVTLKDYIEQNEDPFIASYDHGKNITVIYLLDYNDDNIEDALISKYYSGMMGISYYLIKNIYDPQIVYDFAAFDEIELFYDADMQKVIIKYFKNYGLFTYATSETNYIYLGDEISRTKHVHFSGTSGPEEFYIEVNDEKTVCDEEYLNESINNIEQGLQEFTEMKTFRMTLFEDGSEAIIESLN